MCDTDVNANHTAHIVVNLLL